MGGLGGSGGAVKASKNENARTEWNPLGLPKKRETRLVIFKGTCGHLFDYKGQHRSRQVRFLGILALGEEVSHFFGF